MLLTLYVKTLANRLKPKATGPGSLALVDVPAYVKNELGLSGLTLSTDLLAGVDRSGLQRILEQADKAGCPCLSLVEQTAQPLADPDRAEGAIDRVTRVVQAAHWLGCNAVAIAVESPDDDESLGDVADNLKPLVRKAEKFEMNLCISSGAGLTAKPERLTDLLKKIGGFRVGTLPDFDTAAKSADGLAYLRKLVPYASTVLATSHGFEGKGDKAAHKLFDLAAYMKVVGSVGYEGSLAIDYRAGGSAADMAAGIVAVRDIINRTLGRTEPDEDELDDLDLGEEGPGGAEGAEGAEEDADEVER